MQQETWEQIKEPSCRVRIPPSRWGTEGLICHEEGILRPGPGVEERDKQEGQTWRHTKAAGPNRWLFKCLVYIKAHLETYENADSWAQPQRF